MEWKVKSSLRIRWDRFLPKFARNIACARESGCILFNQKGGQTPIGRAWVLVFSAASGPREIEEDCALSRKSLSTKVTPQVEPCRHGVAAPRCTRRSTWSAGGISSRPTGKNYCPPLGGTTSQERQPAIHCGAIRVRKALRRMVRSDAARVAL